MSRRGLQTLFNCGDPCITVLMVCNSGLFSDLSAAMPGMPKTGKEMLREILSPVSYILDGETHITCQNGLAFRLLANQRIRRKRTLTGNALGRQQCLSDNIQPRKLVHPVLSVEGAVTDSLGYVV